MGKPKASSIQSSQNRNPEVLYFALSKLMMSLYQEVEQENALIWHDVVNTPHFRAAPVLGAPACSLDPVTLWSREHTGCSRILVVLWLYVFWTLDGSKMWVHVFSTYRHTTTLKCFSLILWLIIFTCFIQHRYFDKLWNKYFYSD